MNTITSNDGTKIAFDKAGSGPIVIIVDGALTTRSSGSKPQLIGFLSHHLTVYTYDRRGRGDSGDTPPYAIDREIEDIEALIEDSGGDAFLYGHSSGAALAFEAALKLRSKVKPSRCMKRHTMTIPRHKGPGRSTEGDWPNCWTLGAAAMP
jgi:pimeloyl-ACP methyl ester carboxylesterase